MSKKTTWFKFADTPSPLGVKCIGIWYPDRIRDFEEINFFEVLPTTETWPPTYVIKHSGGETFHEDPPTYWTHCLPEENE